MNDQPAPRRNTTLKVVAIAGAAAVFIGGAVGFQAIADTAAYQHAKLAVTKSHFGGRGDRTRFADMTDAEVAERVDRMTRHLAIEIDATDEQQARIAEIATGVALELRPLRAEMRETREELQNLLLEEEIDRAAVEALRAERIADLDSVSKTVSDGLLDVAEVLTPEQRVQLEERIEEFRFHGRGRRG
ncbi:MAG: periplasmic heavy metal sensor [Pseudomonadota bacterium]